jgi:thioredoxin reductase
VNQLDYLVIGAGPAGLQLGHFLQQKSKNYLIVEKGENVGEFFKTYPRHGQLISINKRNTGFDDQEMNLRWDWNSLLNEKVKFTDYSTDYFPDARRLCDYLEDFREANQVKVEHNFDVENVSRDEHGFKVVSRCGKEITTKKIIVATGFNAEKVLSFPGHEHIVYYSKFNTDPEKYLNKRVLIIGKGNSAFETADSLVNTTASVHLCSPNPVRLAWESHYVGNVRAVNNNFLDTYQLKSQNVILDADIDCISKEGERYKVDITYTHAKGEKRTIYYDHIIAAAGFKFDVSIFDESCQPEMCAMGKFPVLNQDWSSVNVPDMFFAGVLMHSLDYKKTMSGFIHGFRYNVRALSHILAEKYDSTPWHGDAIKPTIEELAQLVTERLTYSSSMFLQPSFFGDLVIDKGEGDLELLTDAPIGYFLDKQRDDKLGRIFVVTLEYGNWDHVTDPFSISRDPAPATAHLAEYIHPVIREYQQGEVVDEFHLLEDLENDYVQPKFQAALEQFWATKY